MGEIVTIPDSDGLFVSSKSGEIDILAVVHNIRTFVAIEICTLRCLSPREVKF